MKEKYRKINTLWKRDMKNKGAIKRWDFSEDVVKNIRKWSITEKIDGQCITVAVTKDDIEVYGKTKNTEFNSAHEPLLTYINEKFTREALDEVLDFTKADKVIFFGEGYGVKINKGGKYLKEGQKFILFDVCIDGIWLEEDTVTFFAECLDIQRVPILCIDAFQVAENLCQMITLSQVSEQEPSCRIEGVVARAHPMVLDRLTHEPIMFKLKVEDYQHLRKQQE